MRRGSLGSLRRRDPQTQTRSLYPCRCHTARVTECLHVSMTTATTMTDNGRSAWSWSCNRDTGFFCLFILQQLDEIGKKLSWAKVTLGLSVYLWVDVQKSQKESPQWIHSDLLSGTEKLLQGGVISKTVPSGNLNLPRALCATISWMTVLSASVMGFQWEENVTEENEKDACN